MIQSGLDVADAGWVSDRVAQQVQEDSPNYGSEAELSGYAALTRPTMLAKLVSKQ